MVRNVKLTLNNATSTTVSPAHDPLTRRDLKVTVTPVGTCSQTAQGTIPASFTAGSQAELDLGQASCDWLVSYENTADDCTVNVTLTDPEGRAIDGFTHSNDGTDANDGKLTLYVDDADKRRLRTADGGGGSVVGTVKFDVPTTPATTCITYFTPQVSISLAADSESGRP